MQCHPAIKPETASGFTLVELSIVLVIIGLIVGGVLVGQDLISAASVRAQISQIERYQTAVNTFRVKYGYLPGDIPNPYASQFGFVARGSNPGQGDGDGVLEGLGWSTQPANGLVTFGGETGMFWVDLSQAGLIEGGFNSASPLYSPPEIGVVINTGNLHQYIPLAKIGNNNSICVWSGGWLNDAVGGTPDRINYFSLANVIGAPIISDGQPTAFAGLTVSQAYAIDNKIDDGLPQSGRVSAMYDAYSAEWAIGGSYDPVWGQLVDGASESWPNYSPVVPGDGVLTNPSSITCYDNKGVSGVEKYSMGYNNGQGMNCNLSFKFQ